jgi:hypothetical protein
MVLRDTLGTAFDKVSMDIVGPLPTTESGNTYLLAIQDLLTKYSVAVPLKQATSSEIAEAIVEKFINSHTAPKAWITDQGSNFISSVMRHVARRYKISMYKTTAYRPHSNGYIERSHHVLMEYLKQWAGKRDWDKYLTYAMKAYNTSVHEGTEFTPHELVFRRTARVPASNQSADDNDNESYPEYATALFKRIFDAQTTARQNIKLAKIRYKRYYERRTNPQTTFQTKRLCIPVKRTVER